MSESTLPQILLESAQRSRGILILSGVRDSGVDAAAETLSRSVASRRVVRLPARESVPADADVILCDDVTDGDGLRRLLGASEDGRLVILVMGATSPLTALRRLLSFSHGEGRRHVMARLADQILLLSGQMKIRGLTAGASEDAREIILMTPPLRAALQLEDVSAVEALLRAGDETSGTVSFNQSLLQLLLRRKIDVKTAFEATSDPGHLDELLKKVGI